MKLLVIAFLLLIATVIALQAQPFATIPLIDIDGPEQKECLRDDVPYLEGLLLANKQATLESIRAKTLQRLQQAAGAPYYTDKRSYAHIEIGNLFSPQIKHAVVAYLSNAHLQSKADYYLNLYVYEVQPQALMQVFKAENLSSYYQSVGVNITDFNLNGIPDLLIATSEPEWYHQNRPSSTYYHLFEYTPAPGKPLFTPYLPLTTIANPKFLNPQTLYTLTDCGTGGYCWLSKLYTLQSNRLPLFIAEAGQFGTNIVQVFLVNGKNKTFYTDLPHIDSGNSPLIEQMWRQLLPTLTTTAR